ncbi:hypothetical protein BJF85_12735 [Saccharomonospora sp. CUA-673]|nr:hypothetical protein BJF85_12735 [Saccharomonospora sp. CUA-673]
MRIEPQGAPRPDDGHAAETAATPDTPDRSAGSDGGATAYLAVDRPHGAGGSEESGHPHDAYGPYSPYDDPADSAVNSLDDADGADDELDNDTLAPDPDPEPEPRPRRRKRGLLLTGTALVLIVAVGVALALPQVSNRLGLPWAPNLPQADPPEPVAVSSQLDGVGGEAPARPRRASGRRWPVRPATARWAGSPAWSWTRRAARRCGRRARTSRWRPRRRRRCSPRPRHCSNSVPTRG